MKLHYQNIVKLASYRTLAWNNFVTINEVIYLCTEDVLSSCKHVIFRFGFKSGKKFQVKNNVKM